MNKIGTHNSATGEKGKGFLSFLVSPFARCQSKTIEEQYNSGCRLFDIRIRECDGKFCLSHGLWKSNKRLSDVLNFLNERECYVMLTYEGKFKNEEDRKSFLWHAAMMKVAFYKIRWLEISVKYGDNNKWQTIIKAEHSCPNQKNFIPLDGSSWHTFIPIPWLWNKLKKRKDFNEDIFLLVDFL